MCLELVQMALMGLSCPLISPTGVKLSTFQTLIMPPRQALSTMGRPGMKARAQTQSLCAFGICCGHGDRAEITIGLTHSAAGLQIITAALGSIRITELDSRLRAESCFQSSTVTDAASLCPKGSWQFWAPCSTHL